MAQALVMEEREPKNMWNSNRFDPPPAIKASSIEYVEMSTTETGKQTQVCVHTSPHTNLSWLKESAESRPPGQ